jgi:hypothetical protein
LRDETKTLVVQRASKVVAASIDKPKAAAVADADYGVAKTSDNNSNPLQSDAPQKSAALPTPQNSCSLSTDERKEISASPAAVPLSLCKETKQVSSDSSPGQMKDPPPKEIAVDIDAGSDRGCSIDSELSRNISPTQDSTSRKPTTVNQIARANDSTSGHHTTTKAPSKATTVHHTSALDTNTKASEVNQMACANDYSASPETNTSSKATTANQVALANAAVDISTKATPVNHKAGAKDSTAPLGTKATSNQILDAVWMSYYTELATYKHEFCNFYITKKLLLDSGSKSSENCSRRVSSRQIVSPDCTALVFVPLHHESLALQSPTYPNAAASRLHLQMNEKMQVHPQQQRLRSVEK